MNPIGVMLNNLERDRVRAFAVAAAEGFRCVHTSALPEGWLHGPERRAYRDAAQASGVTIAAMFVGFNGQSYADLPSIAQTVGLTPPTLRAHRCAVVTEYSGLARELGVTFLALHLGFLPPDPASRDYVSLVESLRAVLDHCAANGQRLLLETGQESAQDLLRLIRAVDRPNLGVNFDPANFLLYGTDDPLNALDCLAPLIHGVHCKDGRRAPQPGVLGTEVPLGQGEVNYPRLLPRLLAHGYRGPLVIEREHGPQVLADVRAARSYLRALLPPV
jgi:sugar phosphate isomerase/epimerase